MNIPHFTKNEIRAIAQKILKKRQPEGGVPIQIEKIVEFKFDLNICPIPGLRKELGFEGSISYDLSTLPVDEDIMKRIPNRYRFTLAHELGHLVLHGDQIRALEINDKDRWKKAYQTFDATEYGRMESQAHRFAGYLLVPNDELQEFWNEALRLGDERGLNLLAMEDAALDYVSTWIAKAFNVSAQVIDRRLIEEGYIDRDL